MCISSYFLSLIMLSLGASTSSSFPPHWFIEASTVLPLFLLHSFELCFFPFLIEHFNKLFFFFRRVFEFSSEKEQYSKYSVHEYYMANTTFLTSFEHNSRVYFLFALVIKLSLFESRLRFLTI